MRTTQLISSVLLLSLGACIGDATLDDPTLAESAAGIVNGQNDPGHEAVVQIRPAGGLFEPCTGTLVGERTVVTAGHCVHNNSAQLYAQMEVNVPVRACAGCAPVMTWRTGMPVSNPNFQAATSTGVDVALIRLNQPVPFVSMSRVPGLAKILVLIDGRPITLVGFGQPDAATQQWNVKRWGTNTIDSSDNTSFYFTFNGNESTTCYGDSGGPAYTGGYDATCILGITKGMTSGQPCTTNGIYQHTRIDRTDIANWIITTANDPTLQTCIPYR